MSNQRTFSRRKFLASSAAGAIALAAAPAVITASKTDSQLIMGEGEYRFAVTHDWPQLPDQFKWQTTHNVAVDHDQNVYIIHEGQEKLGDHPAIFVFDKDGKYVRSFGQQFQGGGHGLEVRTEGSEQFLYVSAYQMKKCFAKLTLTGETIWQHYAPMKSGVYAEGEDVHPEKKWGRDRFMPTNFAFLRDGGFFLIDGYGGYCVHRFDKDANYISTFGGPQEKYKGSFDTPHGIWIDERPGRVPAVVVCDRAHHVLKYFTLSGDYIETIEGFGLPANADTFGDLLLIPELHARVSLLDSKNKVVARLGDDAERIKKDFEESPAKTENGKKAWLIRNDPKQWTPGKFVHPHDACFDAEGNIFVAEWVNGGRITKLTRLS
jgi:hypothetical protein